MKLMKRLNTKLLILCLACFGLETVIAWAVFEAVPHLEDEHAYLFQAKVFASGHVAIDAPPQPASFSVPFVIQLNGQVFGKYPPGYPLTLALGVLIGQPWLINVLAAVLAIIGTYLLARDLFDRDTGLLAAALGVISPMFVLLSGSLLNHTTTLAALIFFAWAFVRSRRIDESHRLRFALLAGGSIGWAISTRPWTAVAVSVPFALLALNDLIRRPRRNIGVYAGILIASVLIASPLPLFNAITTGSPTANTYRLWWSQDTIGFGPNIGFAAGGHTWDKALLNLRTDVTALSSVLFAWPIVSWLPISWVPVGWLLIVLGLVWPARDRRDWALLVPVVTLVTAYLAYWAQGSHVYGPRYYAEALPFLWILGARGVIKFGSTPRRRRLIKVILPVLVASIALLATYPRMIASFGLYNITRHDTDVIAAAEIHHALVFVHSDYWTDYANLSWLNQSRLPDGDIIFSQDLGPGANREVIQTYPDRQVYYYDRTAPVPLVAANAGPPHD